MKTLLLSIFFSFLLSCSSQNESYSNLLLSESNDYKNQVSYTLKDSTGEFLYIKDIKINGNKLITRTKIFNKFDTSKTLEKTVTVSILENELLKPHASQFEIWWEGKRHHSYQKFHSKIPKVTISSNHKSLNETSSDVIEYSRKGIQYCFFSNIVECSILLNAKSKKKEVSFNLIWDSYPYNSDQYIGISNSIFSPATIRIKEDSKGKVLDVYVANQVINIYLDESDRINKLYWVAQGMTLARQE